MMYVLVQLIRGSLPWQHIRCSNLFGNDDYKEIMDAKIQTLPHMLCKNLPKEFENIFEYLNDLDSKETPNYDFIVEMFEKIVRREKIILDMQFDWQDNKAERDKMSCNSSIAFYGGNHKNQSMKVFRRPRTSRGRPSQEQPENDKKELKRPATMKNKVGKEDAVDPEENKSL